jgi:hypothetical protein
MMTTEERNAETLEAWRERRRKKWGAHDQELRAKQPAAPSAANLTTTPRPPASKVPTALDRLGTTPIGRLLCVAFWLFVAWVCFFASRNLSDRDVAAIEQTWKYAR